MMTMAPPVVQPSLGLMALMHGVAKDRKEKVKSVFWWLKFGVWRLTVLKALGYLRSLS